MHIGERTSSSASDGSERDTSSTQDTTSTHFQHLVQLITSSAARNQAALVRQAARVANDEESDGHAGPSRNHQTFLLETRHREIAEHGDLLQEHTGSTRSAQRLSSGNLTGHGKQREDSNPSQQSNDSNGEASPTTTSCHEMVSLKLAQARPKAREIQLTCTICFESLSLHAFPTVPITSACLLEFHRAVDESFVCKSCVNESINAQLSTARPDEINCPSCNQRMSHQDIKTWAEDEIFERYDDMITLQTLQEDGNFIRCCRPECCGGQFHDGGSASPIVTCQACGAMTCYRHSGLPWHEGITCDQFEDPNTAISLLKEFISDLERVFRGVNTALSDEQPQMRSGQAELQSKLRIARLLLSERQAFLASESNERGAKFVAETTKPCPGCKAPVEKVGGCKHIKCRCGYEFCYECLAEWSLSHLGTPCSNDYDHRDILRLAGRRDRPDLENAANPVPAPRQVGLAREIRLPFIEGGIAIPFPPELPRPEAPPQRLPAFGPESPRLQVPQPEVPRLQATQPEDPRLQAPRPEVPRLQATRPEVPRPTIPHLQATQTEAARPQFPRLEVPNPDPRNRVNLPMRDNIDRLGPFASRSTAQRSWIRGPEDFVRPWAPYPHREERRFQNPGPQTVQIGSPRSPMSTAAQVNHSRSDLNSRSDPVRRSRFTRSMEEALLDAGFYRYDAPDQRVGHAQGMRDPIFQDGMARAQLDLARDDHMHRLARHYVQAGQAMGLTPAVIMRDATEDFRMHYEN